MKKPIIIAEVGCNHKGDLEIAKELIKIAKIYCKADVVKFQKRDNQFWASKKPDQYYAPHPNPNNSYGDTYLAHREFLEFKVEQHKELLEYCNEIGIIYSTSVWDLKSAQEIAKLNPKMIKIPSACNNNYEMLTWICQNYDGEIHVSTGMTTKNEIDELVEFFVHKGRNKDVILYNCTSGYPVPFKDIKLLEIKNFSEKYMDKVKAIGFSGHHIGTAVDIAAFTLGATFIERHFTLDRTWKGTDHAASLTPEELRRLVIDINNVWEALDFKGDDILDIEKEQRKKLRIE